jgi:hypothetical protein
MRDDAIDRKRHPGERIAGTVQVPPWVRSCGTAPTRWTLPANNFFTNLDAKLMTEHSG